MKLADRSRAAPARNRPGAQSTASQTLFGAVMGAFLGLALLKFGNPVILDRLVPAPQNFLEFIYQPWPLWWGYGFLPVLLLLGLRVARFQTAAPKWLLILPLVWWFWQLLSGTQSIEPALTKVTLKHFTACLLFFYLGLFAMTQVRNPLLFGLGLSAGFVYVLWTAFMQHYGGLEETRRYFYSRPDWQQFPPEYLKRMATNRVFGTLVYPNALAGAVLLLLPFVLLAVWRCCVRLTFPSRAVITGLVGYAGIACLVWSGSKGGWLVLLFQAAVLLVCLPLAKGVKYWIVGGILVLGLAGFTVRYLGYFKRGAPSAVARTDYWKAAWTTFKADPFLGSGPGTFSAAYKKIKPPNAEMAMLVHNDYLQQASDSGIPGFMSFLGLYIATIAIRYRKSIAPPSDPLFVIWLGLVAWAAQAMTEFGLYIPALAWPAFMMMGWLAGNPPPIGPANSPRQPGRYSLGSG